MRQMLLGMSLVVTAALGCSGERNKPTPVEGKVFYRGQPVSGGTIVFTPDPERGGRGPMACGEIGPDGHYALQTEMQTGAVPGWHRITVLSAPPTGSYSSASPLPSHYSDPEQSGLLYEVKPGALNMQDLQLE